MVKAESVKSEIKSRTATHSGNLSQRYPLFAEGVKKKSESVKSGASVKSFKFGSGSASQRSGRMAQPWATKRMKVRLLQEPRRVLQEDAGRK